jgi:hypothetical protein
MPEADQAARKFQAAATDSPKLLARNITENAAELTNPTSARRGAGREVAAADDRLPVAGSRAGDARAGRAHQGSPDFIQARPERQGGRG